MTAAAALPGLYEELAFRGAWRRYQRDALAAFERERAAGARRWHLVAPPGSGKTLLGVELVRRLGRRALVLAPSGAGQMQWARTAQRQFGAPAGTAGAGPAFPIACFSYESLCGLPARAGDIVARLRAAGVGVVVLDDCHHLASPWGPIVGSVLAELGDVQVIGLASTDLGEDLVGPVTFTVPTPAMVCDGHLAPYQELAWLVEPLDAERRWLAEHENRAAEAERLVTHSRAKELGLVSILATEIAARGDGLRALVLCDSEAAEAAPELQLEGVLDPAAGTARHALVALGADARTAPLRPLLVSGRGLFCLPADADLLLAALVSQAERHLALPEWEAEPDGVLVSLRSHGAEWVPRAWVELATRVLESGVSGALVGTGALLGEGWECPAVNCLVDLSVGAEVQQTRGLSLRLDPADPGKLASNWEVVCAAPGLPHGGADYERFARRHRHLHAPADDGELEAGPSHVHPELGPSAPPADRFAAINAVTASRAAARDEARERWRIGGAYRGVEMSTLVVRGAEPQAAGGSAPVSQRLPLGFAFGGAALAVTAAVATGAAALLAGLVALPAGLGWAAARLRRARGRLPAELPLEAAARAVADAYRELGELTDEAARSLTIAPRSAGYVRCRLPEGTPEEAARFVRALDELVGARDEVGAAPAYLVARPLPDPGTSAPRLLARVLVRRPPFPLRHHPVPSDLARDRAAAFARAWRRRVGPTAIVAAGHEPASGGYAAFVRDVWV